MTIEHLGLHFHLLKPKNLELLRGWRNSEHLREFMHDRTHITSEAQQQWYQKINNERFLYLLLEHGGGFQGSFFFKDIDNEQGSCEIGFLVGEKELLTSIVAATAQVCMMDFAFYLYGLKEVHGHALKNNKRAWTNYLQLGGKVIKESDEKSIHLSATRTDYEKKRPSLVKAIARLQGVTTDRITLNVVKEEKNDHLVSFITRLSETQGVLKNTPVDVYLNRN